MGWTSKMRVNRYPGLFERSNGHSIRNMNSQWVVESKSPKVVSDDTMNRKNVLNEIGERCKTGEKLDDIVKELAEREEIKQQFDYFIKNGITDLASIFKNWYEGIQRNKEKTRN